jgi:hypothetical protein
MDNTKQGKCELCPRGVVSGVCERGGQLLYKIITEETPEVLRERQNLQVKNQGRFHEKSNV